MHASQGRVLGGSSAINGLIFTPPPESNITGWAKLGNPGWEWPSFSKSMMKSFSLTDKTKQVSDGALQISYPDQSDNQWFEIWKNTLNGLGISVTGDLFTGKANGLIINPENIHPATKLRSYALNAYLTPINDRANLTVITQAAVERINFKQSDSVKAIAESVQFVKDSEVITVTAGKEVILAAGGINSPMLLEKSGIGSAKLLKNLGIDVVVANPNVGENLQNHVMVTVSFEVKEGLNTIDPLIRQDPAALAAAAAAYEKQSGPLATSNTSVTAQLPFPGIQTEEGKRDLDELIGQTLDANVRDGSLTTPFDKAHKDFIRSVLYSTDEASGCYITAPGWAGLAPDGSRAPPPGGNGNYFSVALLSTHSLSRGSTHITSKSASSPDGVIINPKYLSHPLDVEVFARNLRQVETLFASEPLVSQLKPGGNRNPPAASTGFFADLENGREYVRNAAVGAQHYVGTCSMMPREMGGVVDPQLLVYGTENLRVCDSSIIPLIPRANVQAAVYGVAEHGATIIKSSMN